MATFYISVGW